MSVEVAAGAVIRPMWRRGRFWLVLAGALLMGAFLIAALGPRTKPPLDPESPSKSGSQALASVLRGYGVRVQRTARVADALAARSDETVLVVRPDAYSSRQRADLESGAARLILLEPGTDRAGPAVTGVRSPDCSLPGAKAAGPVDFRSGATSYPDSAGTACYGGAVVVGGRLVRLGSAQLLRNDELADRGVAALDVNLLSADRTTRRVIWLMPGTDAAGAVHVKSVWDLFPSGAHRAFLWLLLSGAVVVLWRARRLGPPVSEPLPVIVRAAELVEGHGRLYRRAGARGPAALAVRAGTSARLARHLGLARGSTPAELSPAVAAATGDDATWVARLLAGTPPADDAALIQLAENLQRLEEAAGVPSGQKGER